MLYIVYRKVHIYYIYHKIEKMNKTVMDLLFFYEIDNQECWVSRSVRGLEVGKIHGIWGVAGQSCRVSGDFVRENECYISRVTSTRNDVLLAFWSGWLTDELSEWHIKGDEYQLICTVWQVKHVEYQAGCWWKYNFRLDEQHGKKIVLKIWKD